jgi:hypothetical protein
MRFASVLAVALAVGGIAPASASAVLEQANGTVLANGGNGFADVASGAALPNGTRVMVKATRNAKNNAVIRFEDGCSIPLSGGQVFTVGEDSPCKFRAQVGETGGGLSPLVIGAGGLVVVGGAIGVGLALSHQGTGHLYNPYLFISH